MSKTYSMWFFRYEPNHYGSASYLTDQKELACRWYADEYGDVPTDAVRGHLTFPEYRALLFVNQDHHDWPKAYEALMGVYFDAMKARESCE